MMFASQHAFIYQHVPPPLRSITTTVCIRMYCRKAACVFIFCVSFSLPAEGIELSFTHHAGEKGQLPQAGHLIFSKSVISHVPQLPRRNKKSSPSENHGADTGGGVVAILCPRIRPLHRSYVSCSRICVISASCHRTHRKDLNHLYIFPP